MPKGLDVRHCLISADALDDGLEALDENTRQPLDNYLFYAEDRIDLIPFQHAAVQFVREHPKPLLGCEIAPGGGKSIIMAMLAYHMAVENKPSICICPNPLALGSETRGIINKFHSVFNSKQRLFAVDNISRLNDPDPSKLVHFFTPACLYNGLYRSKPSRANLLRRIIDRAEILLVDEAHHFAKDVQKRQKIFSDINRIGEDCFLSKGKKVVGFSATFLRMDGQLPLGLDRLDPSRIYRFTIQDTIDAHRAPAIFGISVYLDIRAPDAVSTAEGYELNLRGKEYENYIEYLAECMTKVYERHPRPTCAFVSRTQHARDLCEAFNRLSGIQGRGLAPLTGKTKPAERECLIKDIMEGRRLGYVTCNVGAEALDVPPLSIVHMIRRTKSLPIILQQPGRGMRLFRGNDFWPTKDYLLLIDYQVNERRIIDGCLGLMDFIEGAGSRVIDPRNGGLLVGSRGVREDKFVGGRMLEMKEWVKRRQFPKTSDVRRESVLIMHGSKKIKRDELVGKTFKVNTQNGKVSMIEVWDGDKLFRRIEA